MSTAWAHLPNAAHIDRVLAHAKAAISKWEDLRATAEGTNMADTGWMPAWGCIPNAARIAAQDSTWIAARDEAWALWSAANRGPALNAARLAMWDLQTSAQPELKADLKEARESARAAVWGARDAIIALIAWDDCAHLLDAPEADVRGLAAHGHRPAILLLPAVLAMKGLT